VSLQTRLQDLATAVATDIKQHRTWITGSSSGDLTALQTVNQSSLVAAINEVLSGAGTGDVTQAELDELAQALGDDANFAATVTAALANRVRADVADQGLDPTQQANARTNIGAVAASDIGDPTIDLVAVYTTAKA
jgi:hypothetical protein